MASAASTISYFVDDKEGGSVYIGHTNHRVYMKVVGRKVLSSGENERERAAEVVFGPHQKQMLGILWLESKDECAEI